MLEKYLEKFSRLRTDKNRNRYPAYTYHSAPHKPFLLLSIMDLIAQGRITENFIEPSFELVDTWNGYWNAIMPLGHRSSMAYPFPRLRTDGFWHLVANHSFNADADYNVTSMVKCREIYAGARMDDELFQNMCNPETREQLCATLIQTYFVPEFQLKVQEQGTVNIRSYEYATGLLASIKEQTSLFEDAPEDTKKHIRDQGFRKAIVTLYDHRCALCGIRMLTPEGHTIVEAAHIIPWSKSHDDQPTNGLCLCRLCHWSFDKGLMSVGKKYEVLVSNRVRIDRNMPGHILTLAERPIFKPDEEHFWPGLENLDQHRKTCFIR